VLGSSKREQDEDEMSQDDRMEARGTFKHMYKKSMIQ
jgi:hypothetical protein